MLVEDMVEVLSKCHPKAKIKIIQEEELECMSEWWDGNIGDYGDVHGPATKIHREDLHSHYMYILAIKPSPDPSPDTEKQPR